MRQGDTFINTNGARTASIAAIGACDKTHEKHPSLANQTPFQFEAHLRSHNSIFWCRKPVPSGLRLPPPCEPSPGNSARKNDGAKRIKKFLAKAWILQP